MGSMKTRQIKITGPQKSIYEDNCFIIGAGCPKQLWLDSVSTLLWAGDWTEFQSFYGSQ